MAKITLENGVIVEGTIEELTELAKAFGAEKPEYVKVEGRKPIVGDYVKFTDEEVRSYLKREYYEIVEFDSNDDPQIIDDDGDEYDCYNREYDVYEKIAKDAPEQKLENLGAVDAQKGDFVKFHENHDRTIAGKLYEVINDSDIYMAEDGFTRYSTSGWGGNSKRDVYRTLREFSDVEPLKVGDYVKITDNGIHGSMFEHGFGIGEIVKVKRPVEDLVSKDRIQAEYLDGRNTWYVHIDDFVRATDEEVEKANVDAKFKKIGRKPGEFKKGDIVRLNQYSGSHEKGSIIEVVDKGTYRAPDGNWAGDYDWYELIAPVESRVDTVD